MGEGSGGLLDVAVHPQYAENGWIYLSFSDPGEDDSAMTKIVRGRLRDGHFIDQQVLFKAPAALYRTGDVHFRSRFVFDGKGHLFFTIGERGHQLASQLPLENFPAGTYTLQLTIAEGNQKEVRTADFTIAD